MIFISMVSFCNVISGSESSFYSIQELGLICLSFQRVKTSLIHLSPCHLFWFLLFPSNLEFGLFFSASLKHSKMVYSLSPCCFVSNSNLFLQLLIQNWFFYKYSYSRFLLNSICMEYLIQSLHFVIHVCP